MAKTLLQLHLLFLLLFLSLHHSDQLQLSDSQSILKIQHLLNYPSVFSSLYSTTDYCSIEPAPALTIVCYEDKITQLHIIGNNEFPPLHQNFSTVPFFEAVSGLSSLKVLSLVSLGLWGPLPEPIGQLSSLEILNVSSNYLSGDIPGKLASLRDIQTLILDNNKFTGKVPSWLSSFPGLAVLSLKNNSLSGSLPHSLASLVNLRVLKLSNNNLVGELPELSNLTNLQILDLENNYFGPNFPSLSNRLVTLVLRNNSFQFGIPSELGSYYQLQKLDISLNRFAGPFLPSLLTLPSMNYIDVSSNKFTGKLLDNMSCNAEISYVDLSSNLLTGNLPSCFNFSSKNRVVKYAGNCLLNDEQHQHSPKFCHNEALAVEVSPGDEENHKRPGGSAVLASSTMGGAIGGFAIVGLAFLIFRRLHKNRSESKLQTRLIMEKVPSVNTVKLLSDARYISQTMKLGATLPAYRTFSLEELKEATNNFHASNLLGESSQGQVFKGKLADGSFSAIRSLTARKKHKQQAYMHQIELISKLRHANLVSSLGHCFDCSQDDLSNSRIFLIFEFVPDGTLRDFVSKRIPGKNLAWAHRIGAAIGVARGVQFLHTGFVPGLFSNNLKITDVLLDHDLQVKLCSYNVPLLSETMKVDSVISIEPRNFGARKREDDTKDIYDLGIILLEIIVGRPIEFQSDVTVSRDILHVSMKVDETARRNVLDPAIQKECSDESVKIMMELTIRCLADKPSDRPSVEDVLWNLQFAAQLQESSKGESRNSHESTPAYFQQ